jgi:hypothetical protein
MIATHSTAQFIFSTLVTGYPTVPLQPRADEGEVGAKEGAGSGTPRHVDEHEQPRIDLSKAEIASRLPGRVRSGEKEGAAVRVVLGGLRPIGCV